MKPGIYFDIPRHQYDGFKAVNWSTLRLMGKSPFHYKFALDHPEANDTDLLQRGIAGHVATLEPTRYGGRVYGAEPDMDHLHALYEVWPEANGRRGTKAWDAAEADCKRRGVTLIRQVDHEWCVDIAKAVHASEMARPFLQGQREATIVWNHEEPEVGGLAGFTVAMRGRIDQVAYRDELPFALVDLKTTRDASPDGFAREAARYGYHAQAALYSDGYSAACGLKGEIFGKSTVVNLPFYWIAVESEPPHAVGVYRLSAKDLLAGRTHYRELLQRRQSCIERADYPAYSTAPIELELPPWAAGSEDLEAA